MIQRDMYNQENHMHLTTLIRTTEAKKKTKEGDTQIRLNRSRPYTLAISASTSTEMLMFFVLIMHLRHPTILTPLLSYNNHNILLKKYNKKKKKIKYYIIKVGFQKLWLHQVTIFSIQQITIFSMWQVVTLFVFVFLFDKYNRISTYDVYFYNDYSLLSG